MSKMALLSAELGLSAVQRQCSSRAPKRLRPTEVEELSVPKQDSVRTWLARVGTPGGISVGHGRAAISDARLITNGPANALAEPSIGRQLNTNLLLSRPKSENDRAPKWAAEERSSLLAARRVKDRAGLKPFRPAKSRQQALLAFQNHRIRYRRENLSMSS